MNNIKRLKQKKDTRLKAHIVFTIAMMLGFFMVGQFEPVYAQENLATAQTNLNEKMEESATFRNIVEKETKYTTRFGLRFQTELTDWQFYLYQNPAFAVVYGNLSSQLNNEGARIYSDEFIIGLLANISYEGSPGVVEQAFSRYHHYGFHLPSGGEYIANLSDINYLTNWSTKSKTKEGSCGVSCVQWSYGRRLTWLNILKSNLILDGRTQCTLLDYLQADAAMFKIELAIDGYYYPIVLRKAEANGGSAASYAEAICDFYEMPSGADLNMSGTGTPCKERRAMASQLWGIFSNKHTNTYNFVSPTNIQ